MEIITGWIASVAQLFGSGMAVAAYVLWGIGLYTIAQNRKIDHPWLAWVPVANLWLLGCISDQYRYVKYGQERNRRGLLLFLGIVQVLVPILTVSGLLLGIHSVIRHLYTVTDLLNLLWPVLGLLAAVLAWIVIWVLMCVFRCLALSDLFSSCQPADSGLFMVLTILACLFNLDLVPALLVCIVCHKEDGMPPRASAPSEVVESAP